VTEIVVEFDRSTQSIGALREAAYRLIGAASCTIQSSDRTLVCRLEANKSGGARNLAPVALRKLFLDLVTDENLREKVAAETSATRDLILALAFGALATQENRNPID
jgi:His-Xaa-Ser system protein HxsD